MSTFVISDIHGCYHEFIELLNKISFCPDDLLILAGDYIDRGPDSYEMLQWLSKRPENVIAIRGNHEVEYSQNLSIMQLLDTQENLETNIQDVDDCLALYNTTKYFLRKSGIGKNEFDRYGGIQDLIMKGADLSKLIQWDHMFEEFPFFYEILLNGKRHMIVHAGYIDPDDSEFDFQSFCVYAREEGIAQGGIPDGTVIFGHTPTVIPGQFCYNDGRIYKYYREEINCEYYGIDCGCVLRRKYPNAKLSCICLENKQEYYV